MSFLTAFFFALVLTPLAARAGVALGLVDRPTAAVVAGGPLKVHERPVPMAGGVAVAVAALAGTAIAGGPPPVLVMGAVLVALGAGHADDLWTLGPALRVQLELGAGVLLLAAGLEVEPLGPLGGAATVALTLACTNAVNLVDGQDGLAGGLGAAAAAGLVGVAGGAGDPSLAALGLATTGALLAFLLWNRSPARIFLGDGGAYALGVVLAALAADAAAARGWWGLVSAAICLGPFALELVVTVLRRVTAGRPLSAGDRQHTYDLVARRLGSRTRTTLAYWLVGTVAAALGVGLAWLFGGGTT